MFELHSDVLLQAWNVRGSGLSQQMTKTYVDLVEERCRDLARKNKSG